MKTILETLLKLGKFLFPKSRIGNVIYLVIGFLLANFETFQKVYDLIVDLIKSLSASLF